MAIRNLVEEQVLAVGEDLIEKVGFVLAYPPYNIRREQNDAHVAYNVLEMNNMKDMAEALEDVKKPGL